MNDAKKQPTLIYWHTRVLDPWPGQTKRANCPSETLIKIIKAKAKLREKLKVNLKEKVTEKDKLKLQLGNGRTSGAGGALVGTQCVRQGHACLGIGWA